MKKFLTKTVNVLSLTLITVCFLYSVFYLIEKKINKQNIESNKLAIIGHSHPKHAINDSIISDKLAIKTKNYGVNGQAMFWSIMGARKLKIQGYNFFIIELTNNTYTTDWKKVDDKRMVGEIHKKFFIKKGEWFELLKKAPLETFKLFSKQILPRTRVRGEFTSLNTKYQPKIIKENLNNRFKPDFDDVLIHDFIRSNKKSKIILIRSPQHPDYYKNIDPNNERYFLNKIKQFKKYKNCIILDFGHIYKSDRFFSDPGHMNNIGGKEYSNFLGDTLRKYDLKSYNK